MYTMLDDLVTLSLLMKCKDCNAESPDDSRYCSQCATPFTGGTYRDANESKSTTALGARRSVQSFARFGERRQISIMFSDIIGSTALSESLDSGFGTLVASKEPSAQRS